MDASRVFLRVILLGLPLVTTTPFIPAYQQVFPVHYQIVWSPVNILTRSSLGDQALPCLREGFFVNPGNCSTFYRCVDYTGSGIAFSRYHFQCPSAHIFLEGKDTCVPGTCLYYATPVSDSTLTPGTPAFDGMQTSAADGGPAASTDETTTAVSLEAEGMDSSSDGSQSQGAAEELPGTPSKVTSSGQTEDTTEKPSAPDKIPSSPEKAPSEEDSSLQEQTTVAPETTETPGQESSKVCVHLYQQDQRYCNVYSSCEVPGVRYACNPGTVFDEERQMCRISAQDEALCSGKEIMALSLYMRYSFPWYLATTPADEVAPLPSSMPLMERGQPTATLYQAGSSPLGAPPFEYSVPGSVQTLHRYNAIDRPVLVDYRHPFQQLLPTFSMEEQDEQEE